MKRVFTVLVIIGLNTTLFAQTNRQPKPEPKTQEEAAIMQRQIVDLPLGKRTWRPKLSLQRGSVL